MKTLIVMVITAGITMMSVESCFYEMDQQDQQNRNHGAITNENL